MNTNTDICLNKCAWKRLTAEWMDMKTVMCVKPEPTPPMEHNRLIGDIFTKDNRFEYNYNFKRPITCPYELEHILFSERYVL